MQTVRALARSAPRAAFRLSTSSTPRLQCALRTALQTASVSRIIPTVPRYFSTSLTRRDDAATELAAKLTSEIQVEEQEGSTPADSDANIQHFLSQNPEWEVQDNAGEQDVVMTRKYDDETITVLFSIADFNNTDMEGEDDALMDDEMDDIESAQSGGGNTKGAVNQGRTSGGNIKVAPEDSVAPGDREELRDPEDEGDNQPAFPADVDVLIQRPGKVCISNSLGSALARY